MKMAEWAPIFVALIAVLSAALSGRSARKAALHNSDATVAKARIEAETEAYNRARKLDVDTIQRQDDEIDEIRENNRKLRLKVRELQSDNERLHEENRILKQRVSRLEQHQEEINE